MTRTWPERAMAAAIRRLGFTVEQNVRGLPGTPDIVMRRLKVVVQVHGCFWHGCPAHWKCPKSKPGFWQAKVVRNRARDRQVTEALRRMGWRVVTVWEHEVRQGPAKAAARVAGLVA